MDPLWPSLLDFGASQTSTGTAVRSALSMGVPLLALALARRPEAAAFAAFGAFSGLYAADLPYRNRGQVLIGAGACFVVAVAVGSWLSPLVSSGHMAVWVFALASVAGLAKWGCDTVRIGSPGPWMFLFVFAASTMVSISSGDVAERTGLAAAGACCAWLIVMSGALVDQAGPERRAVSAAVRASSQVLAFGGAANVRDWHRAHSALVRAERFIRDLHTPAGAELRGTIARAERRLTDAVLRQWAPIEPDRSRPCDQAAHPPTGTALSGDIERLRARNRRHASALRMLTAARAVVGVALAGALSVFLHLGHPYWAPVSAAAVLQATHVRMAWHRGVQRALGTAAGLALAAVLLQMHLEAWAIAIFVVLMQLGIELLIVRNYALGVVFITPLTMLMSELFGAGPAHAMFVDRLDGVALGIVVGMAAALLVVQRRAAASLSDALDRCRAATRWAAVATTPDAVAATEELRDALIELRVAEDLARGEPWSSPAPWSEAAEVEHRSHVALAESYRRLRALAAD